MIQVIAIITARSGKRAAVAEAVRADRPAVPARAGRLEYAARADVDALGKDPRNFVPGTSVVARNRQSVGTHEVRIRAAHLVECVAKFRELIASRAIRVVESAA